MILTSLECLFFEKNEIKTTFDRKHFETTNFTRMKPKQNSKSEGNKYDKIIKENLCELAPAILRKVLGLQDIRMKDLPQTRQQTTIEREPDFLKLVYDKTHPKGRIVQIEFEGKSEKHMNARLLEYLGIVYRKYLLPVEQHLVYIGSGKPNINCKIEFGNLKYHFSVHYFSEIHYEQFLFSNQPEEVILSILASPGKETPAHIIRMILERLLHLRGDSRETLKFIRQLEIISNLRKLQRETINQIDTMNISYDIKEDIRYQQGREEGLTEGVEKGLEKGMERGAEKKAITGIRNMLREGFETGIIAKVLEVPQKFVLKTQKALKAEAEIKALLRSRKYSNERIAKMTKTSLVLVEIFKKEL